MFQKKWITIILVFVSSFVFSQATESGYNPHDLFGPNFYPSSVNEFRAADGQPGPKYWTNKANYKIAVTLDDKTDAVKGNVTITYVNNSPYSLDFLWLYLDQNLFTQDSRGQAKMPATGSGQCKRKENFCNSYESNYRYKNAIAPGFTSGSKWWYGGNIHGLFVQYTSIRCRPYRHSGY